MSFVGRDMAVDLGTANTLVYVRGRGIVLNEPSVAAINQNTGGILAVGSEAKKMIGRTPGNIVAIRPLKDGVIADFDTTERMLRYFIQKVHRRRHLAKPRLVICVPSGITGVEQRAVKDAGYAAGARKVYIIEEPMAAAIGANMPVHEPTGNMVVDIGGGTTEVAVISLGGIVTSISIRVGGDELDNAIIQYVKKEYSLLLGERTAEEIKVAIGSAFPMPDEPHAEIRGRDLVSGLPRTVVVTAEEIRRAIDEPVNAIVDVVKTTLDRTPPELSGDIMDRGIVLTGGGALLMGLDEGLVVHLVDVVAREHDDQPGIGHLDRVDVLVDGVGGAEIPVLVDPLLRRQHVQKLAQFPAEEAVPAEIEVAVEAACLVLREQQELPQSAVEAVGEDEVDDPVGAAERHRGLGTIAGERIEPGPLAAGEDHGHDVAHSAGIDVSGTHRSSPRRRRGHRPLTIRPPPLRRRREPGPRPPRRGRHATALAKTPRFVR